MNNRRHSTFTILCLLVFVLMTVALSPTARQAQSTQPEQGRGSGGRREAPKHLEAIATRLVAKQKALKTEGLIVSSSNVLNLPLTGKTAYSYTMTDTQTGFPHSITLDEKGQEVDEELLLAEEQAARTAKYGKFEPELLELIQRASMLEKIRVIITLKIPPDSEKRPEEPDIIDGRPWEDLSQEEKRASELKDKGYRKQKDEYLVRRTKRLTAPLIRWLRSLEYEVKADAYIPIIYATLPVGVIWQVVAWDTVEQIALDGTEQPKLEVSRVAIGADIVESRGNGVFAIQVAQVESLGGRVVSTTGQVNPHLSGTIQDTTFVCSTQHDHAAWIAGVIRCTNSLPPGTRGISPGVTLWAGGSCGGIQSELQNRTTAAADWGAKVINRSSGLVNNSFDLTSNDRFYDSIVSDRDLTMVMVASNETGLPGCPAGVANVQTPAKGYNVITENESCHCVEYQYRPCRIL